MSWSGGRSRAYREYHGGRRDSMVEFPLEGESTQRGRRKTKSDMGGLGKEDCFRGWGSEDDSPRRQHLGWGRPSRKKWSRGGPATSRGRGWRARSEWHSKYDANRSFSDLRWHLRQRRLSQHGNRFAGRQGRQHSFECSPSPHRERDTSATASVRYDDDIDQCGAYEDVDKHDDSYPEYQRYWDTVVAAMEVRSEKRLESKVEPLSDISDDSLVDSQCRPSPKVKSLIVREEVRSRTPKRRAISHSKPTSLDRIPISDIRTSHSPGSDDSKRRCPLLKTGSNKTRVLHLGKKSESSDKIKSSNTDSKASVGRDNSSSSDSDSSSSSSKSGSSSSSDTSDCPSDCSCLATAKGGKLNETDRHSTHVLPPEASPSTPSQLSAPRRSYERGRRDTEDTSFSSFNQSFIVAEAAPSPMSTSSRSHAPLATSTLEASTLSCSTADLSTSSSATTLSSSVLSSSVYSSSDSGNASLLEVSPQRHDPCGFALEQLRRLTRWVLTSCLQRYMPSVRPPHVSGMQMGIQRDTDVNKWVECGVQHVVMVERKGLYVESAKAAHHTAWQSGKCYSVDWVCRDFTREVWPHHPVDVACSHLALHTAFASPSQAELFAHNISCSLKEGSCLVATVFSAARVLSLIRKDESGRCYESRHFKLRIHGYSARSTLPPFGVKISLQIGKGRFEDSLVQLSVLEDLFQAHQLQLLTKRSFMQLFDQTCRYGPCLRQLEALELVEAGIPGRDKLSPAMQDIADLFDVIIFRKCSQSVR